MFADFLVAQLWLSFFYFLTFSYSSFSLKCPYQAATRASILDNMASVDFCVGGPFYLHFVI